MLNRYNLARVSQGDCAPTAAVRLVPFLFFLYECATRSSPLSSSLRQADQPRWTDVTK